MQFVNKEVMDSGWEIISKARLNLPGSFVF